MSVATMTIMARNTKYYDPAKPSLRGVCLVVKAAQRPGDPSKPLPIGSHELSFPQRPNPKMLSESIPLYFIARNRNGFWIAREAEGRTGGIFIFQRSALRFAKRASAPFGCATMFLPQRLELDVANRGAKITAWLNALIGKLGSLIPAYPPAIPIRREIF